MMKREIKFRCYDNEMKLMHHDIHAYGAYQPVFDNMEEFEFHDFLFNKDRFHVMQFTGLHDKTGKEIYEGDIVKDNRYRNTGVVKYGKFALDSDYHYWTMGWYFESEPDEDGHTQSDGLLNEGEEDNPLCTLEIIGNIYLTDLTEKGADDAV